MLSPLVLAANAHNPPQIHQVDQSLPRFSTTTMLPPPPSFDDIVHRLGKLSIPSRPHSPSQQPPSSISFHPGAMSNTNTLFGGQPFALDSPFSYSRSEYLKEQDLPVVIDSFAPRRPSFDLSPTSSTTSSDLDPSVSWSQSSMRRSSIDAFFATRSRVIRLFDLPPPASHFLSGIFMRNRSVPIPATLWTLRDGPGPNEHENIWAVFKSHEEACAALAILPGLSTCVDTALESDLEPFQKLRRFELVSPTISIHPRQPSSDSYHHRSLRMSSSTSDLQGYAQGGLRAGPDSIPRGGEYMISSNPPNPRTSFRLGDWICGSPNCAAHNFGRNLACIGCGCPRPGQRTPSPNSQTSIMQQSNRLPSSPRFISPPNSRINTSVNFSSHQSSMSPMHSPSTFNFTPQGSSPLSQGGPSPSVSQHPHSSAGKPPSPVHHLLTPSGRSFSVGGKVQNISTDPLSPCVMYWPDNEAFPEQGQIRPSIVMGVPQPPILNTGNRGPIEHQPGDWICLKCNYLNWRRRKVCQTCYPYAEGNGDSISAAVQAERIALLQSVLAQGHSLPLPSPSEPSQQLVPQPIRSQSLTPPHNQGSFIDISPPPVHPPVHRSQSHFELGVQYTNVQPIYQTSVPRQSSYSYPMAQEHIPNAVGYAPAPLLPAFLQDIVRSPTLSPTSTSPSSAELSIEEYDDKAPYASRRLNNSSSSSSLSISNIWKLSGDEGKGYSGLALPNRELLAGAGRRESQEMLRRSSQTNLS